MTGTKTGTGKVYGPDQREGFLGNREILAALGTPDHIRQFTMVTMATTKDQASIQFIEIGVPYSTHHLRVQRGNYVEALVESGLPTVNDWAVFIWHEGLVGDPIVRAASRQPPRVVAHWGRSTDPAKPYLPTVILVAGAPGAGSP